MVVDEVEAVHMNTHTYLYGGHFLAAAGRYMNTFVSPSDSPSVSPLVRPLVR